MTTEEGGLILIYTFPKGSRQPRCWQWSPAGLPARGHRSHCRNHPTPVQPKTTLFCVASSIQNYTSKHLTERNCTGREPERKNNSQRGCETRGHP